MSKNGGEILTYSDVNNAESVTSVLLLSKNPVGNKPIEKYTLHAIIRMQGWGDLSHEEKTVTYPAKVAKVIDQEKSNFNAPLGGFINLPEAKQMLNGTLDNAVSQALRSTRKSSIQIIDIFFKDGEIEVLKQGNQDDALLLLNAG